MIAKYNSQKVFYYLPLRPIEEIVQIMIPIMTIPMEYYNFI